MFFNYFFQLIIVSISTARFISLDESSNNETHTFRWALDDNLTNSTCATAITPPRFENGTADPAYWKHVSSKYLASFLHHFYITQKVMTHLDTINFSPMRSIEDRQAACRSNDSLFVLVGNPGIVWHPMSGQCLHTTLDTFMVNKPDSSDPGE